MNINRGALVSWPVVVKKTKPNHLQSVHAKPSGQIDLPKCLSTTRGLIKFKYEKHDIQAAFSGGAVDLRNTLAVGSKMRVDNFWKGDHLSISVVKHNVNPDLTQDVDFKV